MGKKSKSKALPIRLSEHLVVIAKNSDTRNKTKFNLFVGKSLSESCKQMSEFGHIDHSIAFLVKMGKAFDKLLNGMPAIETITTLLRIARTKN